MGGAANDSQLVPVQNPPGIALAPTVDSRWPACYVRRDVPGRILRCRCVPRKVEHPACWSCLILIGTEHVEQFYEYRDLPALRESFDDAQGVWVRALVWDELMVCTRCVDDIDSGRYPYTIRLDLMTAKERKDRAERWLADHPDIVVTRRYLGGYIRPTTRRERKS